MAKLSDAQIANFRECPECEAGLKKHPKECSHCYGTCKDDVGICARCEWPIGVYDEFEMTDENTYVCSNCADKYKYDWPNLQ